MAHRDGLVLHICRETVWGPRGLSKVGAMGLPIALALSEPGGLPRGIWFDAAMLLLAGCCFALSGILANDLADSADDISAGKRRWLHELRPRSRVAVVAGLAVLGFAPLAATQPGWHTHSVYAAAVALALSYSLPPMRLKARGSWGLAAFGASIALCYAVLPWTCMPGHAAPLSVAAAAIFLDRWVNLHFHQIIDHDADAQRAVATYVVRAGIERGRRTLGLAATAAAAALLVVVAWAWNGLDTRWPVVVTSAVAASAWIHASRGRRRLGASPLLVELPPSYLALNYAVLRVLPPLLFARHALKEPTMWPIFVALAFAALVDTRIFLRYRYR